MVEVVVVCSRDSASLLECVKDEEYRAFVLDKKPSPIRNVKERG